MLLPTDPRPFLHDEPMRTGPLLFLRSIRRVIGRAPLWLLPALLLPTLALPVGLAWHAFLGEAVGNRYQSEGLDVSASEDPTAVTPDPAFPLSLPSGSFHWDDLVYSLTPSFRHDHREGLKALDSEVAQMGAALALLSMLAGVFLAGGWLQVMLERTHGRTLRRFCMGGGRYFMRFLRVLVILLVLLGAWRWLIYGPLWERHVTHGWFGVPMGDRKLESLDSEATQKWLGWLQAGVHFAGFALLLAWATFVRTRLAMHDGRSALKAGFLSAWTLVRHPLRTLTPLVLLWLTEALIASLALGALVQWLERGLIERPSAGLIGAMALASFLALAVREVLRGARYHAAVKVSQTIVRRPKKQEDPWQSIGGPGGPQYPVGDDGESYVPM
jgi:hypothetical protein